MSRRHKFLGLATASALVLQLTAVSAMATEGTMVIDTPGRVTLAEDHVGNIEIISDDVILDCAGFSVKGPVDSPNRGISIDGVDNVTVKNCYTTGFRQGLLLRDGSGHRILNNTFEANDERQILLVRTTDSVVESNLLSGGSSGLSLFDSDRNTVLSNTIDGSTHNGIVLDRGFPGLGSNDNLVKGNEIRGGPSSLLIGVFASTGNSIKDNVTDGGSDGFYFENTTANLVSSNTSVNAADVGFAAGPDANDNVFRNNTAAGYGGNGFNARQSHGNLFQGNHARGGDAFSTQLISDTVFRSNVVAGSETGFLINESDEVRFQGNAVSSSIVGYRSAMSSSVSFRGNHVTGTESGFVVEDSVGVIVEGNFADRNGNGVVLHNSVDSVISANSASHNSDTGILLTDTQWSTVSRNVASNNGSFGLRLAGISSSNVMTLNAGCGNGVLDAADESAGPNLWSQNDFCTSEIE